MRASSIAQGSGAGQTAPVLQTPQTNRKSASKMQKEAVPDCSSDKREPRHGGRDEIRRNRIIMKTNYLNYRNLVTAIFMLLGIAACGGSSSEGSGGGATTPAPATSQISTLA